MDKHNTHHTLNNYFIVSLNATGIGENLDSLVGKSPQEWNKLKQNLQKSQLMRYPM